MDASSFDDKLFQDMGVDLSLFPDQDPFLNFSSIPEMNFADFVTPDVLRDFVEPVLSPMMAQLPEQPSCYDDFDCGLALSPTPTPPPSFRSSAGPKRSELSAPASPSVPVTRMRSAVPTRAAAAAASAPKLHPTYAPSPAMSMSAHSPGSIGGGRGCPKRHRKTIQLKRQEQQGRLESLTTRNAKLQDAIRLAASEVSAARQTLYTVLKTAREGHLDAFSPAP